jgi:hypothetical protein
VCDRLEEMFAVVEHQQKLLVAQELDYCLLDRLGRPRCHREQRRDRVRDTVAVADRCQLTPPGAVTELGKRLRRHLQRQTGLAHPTHPGQGHCPDLTERGGDTRQLALAADERARRRRQVPHERVQRPQRREFAHQIGVAHLEDSFGTTQVAQAVLPQVDQPHTLGQRVTRQRLGRVRNEHLTAMGEGHQPGASIQRPIHVLPWRTQPALVRVQSHAHQNWTRVVPRLGSEPLLSLEDRAQRIRCRNERSGHSIAHRREDDTLIAFDRAAHDLVVPRDRLLHRLGVLLPQPRRTLDVGEEERHGSRR